MTKHLLPKGSLVHIQFWPGYDKFWDKVMREYDNDDEVDNKYEATIRLEEDFIFDTPALEVDRTKSFTYVQDACNIIFYNKDLMKLK